MSDWINELTNEVAPSAKILIAWSGEVEFVKAAEDDSAGRTLKLKLIRPPEGQHPFAQFTRRRRGQAGTRFNVAFAEIGGVQELMVELMLLNWAAGPRGEQVTFEVNAPDISHPFLHCRRASKDTPGTRWMITVVEIDDSEQAVQQEKQELVERAERIGNSQKLSNVARLLTKNENFHRFLRDTEDAEVEWNVDIADEWLKARCGIDSKAELDSSGPEAVRPIVAFHKTRTRFVSWQEDQGLMD